MGRAREGLQAAVEDTNVTAPGAVTQRGARVQAPRDVLNTGCVIAHFGCSTK